MGTSFFTKQFRVGFFAPIDSLKFLVKHKGLLFIGLAPHLAGVVGYFWALRTWVVPLLVDKMSANGVITATTQGTMTQSVAVVSIYIIGMLLYALLGLPLVTVCANPIYDVVAGSTFEKTTGQSLPPSTLRTTLRSLLSEVIKLCILFILICIGFIVPISAPIIFLISIWYLGWDFMDRTLSMLQKTLRSRVLFGVRHPIACCMLGLWIYIPFAGSLLAFVMASAGAMAVGQLIHPSFFINPANTKPQIS